MVSGMTKVVDSLQAGLPEDISRYFGMFTKKDKKHKKGKQKQADAPKRASQFKQNQTSTDIVRSVMSGGPTPTGQPRVMSKRPQPSPNKAKTASKKRRQRQKKAVKPKGGAPYHETRQVYQTAEEIKEHALAEFSGPSCPYCGARADIKTAKEHTGRDASYCYWVCPSCPNVSVTTYGKTYHPAGVMADAQTRRFRSEVQRLIAFKKQEFSHDRFKLNEWIQQSLNVESEQAWVGQLSKQQLHHLARAAQKEQFIEKYSHIFR